MISCTTVNVWVERIVYDIVKNLNLGLSEKGRASLLVSGGSTPAPIYQDLSQQKLDWSKIDIALVDERWVDHTDQASNTRLIHETLLINQAARATFKDMKTDHNTAQHAVAAVNNSYQNMGLPFDVVVLGMGSDGHTASLFPYSQGLAEALDTNHIVAPIMAKKSNVTGNNLERMTLTGPAIATARSVILALKGAAKKDTYVSAMSCEDHHLMPVKAFMGADNFTTYWTA